MATVQVRYIVDDVDAAIAFYTEQFGFKLEMHPVPPFAMLSMGDLRLLRQEGPHSRAFLRNAQTPPPRS